MINPSTVGNVTEGRVLAALLQLGKRVLIPFGDGARYDLAYDESGSLIRVQCKTGRLKSGSVIFNTCSNHRDGMRINYGEDADWFGVFCSATDKVYLVPVKLTGTSSCSLRVDPTRNGQSKNVLWAKDFEV